MPSDPLDPFFDPDDLSHNLFASGYELDAEGLAITVSGLPRDEPGDHEGLHLVDQDSLGRAVGLPVPDPDDLAAAEDRDLRRARGRVRGPADRRGPDEGVAGARRPSGDAERDAGESAPAGGADNPGTDPRVLAYLRDPKNVQVLNSMKAGAEKESAGPQRFTRAKFPIEMSSLKILPSGSVQMVVVIPYEGQDEVLKLGKASGMLLEASVSAVTRKIK